MTNDRSHVPGSTDPGAFEAELSRHLKAGPESVPPRLARAVDRSLTPRSASASTRMERRYPGPVGVMAVFGALVVGALVVLGSLAILGGLPTVPGFAAFAPSATASPAMTPEAVVLKDGTVIDPGVVDAVDELVGGLPSPIPRQDEETDARTIVPELMAELPAGVEPTGLVPDARSGAIFVDEVEGTVHRANLKTGKLAPIARAGDKPRDADAAIGTPVEVTAAGPDVVIIDDQGRPWGWRPNNAKGAGALVRVNLGGPNGFEEDHGDVEAFDPDFGSYRIYVVEPGLDQIMRYQQTLDGQSFMRPSEYLASSSSDVDTYDQLYVDFDVYALADNGLRRFTYGKYDGGFALDQPPGVTILGGGPDYRFVNGSGRQSTDGRLYLSDDANDRIVGFSKVDGSYLGEWASGADEMDDIRGMFVIEGGVNKKGKRKNDDLVWVTPHGIYRARLPVAAG